MKLGLNFGLNYGDQPSGGGGASSYVQPIVMIGASNTAGGDDSAGAALAAADESSDLRWFDVNNASGDILALDNSVGIPRPGSVNTVSTTPVINFAKYLKTQDARDIIYVIVPMAVGGRGVYEGGDTSGEGPWSPDGAGAAWALGGSSAATAISGALYKAATNASLISTVNSVIDAEFSSRTRLSPIFFGHPCNENDTPGTTSVLLDKATRCITGIRTAWGDADAPWILYGGPPEWTYSGSLGREQITAVNSELAQDLAGIAFVEGLEGNQHPTEDIHYNNAGYRALGTKLGPALAVAESRSSAPAAWVDWVDGLTNQPDVFYGFYRGLSSYGTGNAIQVDNGTTTTDIAFLSNGMLDIASLLTHAGSGDAWVTIFYDQMGSGNTAVPEGSASALLVSSGELLFQGKRYAWGDDTSNILIKDTSYTVNTTGAILAVGRSEIAGNRVMAAGPQNTLALFFQGGTTGYAAGDSDEYRLTTPLVKEPAWLTSGDGYTLYANYIDSNGMRVNGGSVEAASVGAAFTYGGAGLAWGGRIGQTNRYSNGSHVALAAWDTAPTGADLTAALAWAEAISAVDDL